jgi:NAD(P)H-dependent FMN reductase
MLPAIVHIKLKVTYRLPPYLSIIFNRPVRMRNHTLKVAIILGSTRPGRNGEVVSQWIYQIAKKRSDANFELIDIKDYNLPLLDEPIPPSLGQYTKEHTKTKSLKIDSFDAYIFVTAEYNHGIPGALKNAIDFLFKEWNNKRCT